MGQYYYRQYGGNYPPPQNYPQPGSEHAPQQSPYGGGYGQQQGGYGQQEDSNERARHFG